jgi:hypothetical protein
MFGARSVSRGREPHKTHYLLGGGDLGDCARSAVFKHFPPPECRGDGLDRGVVPCAALGDVGVGRAPRAASNTVHFDDKLLTTSTIKRHALFASCREF